MRVTSSPASSAAFQTAATACPSGMLALGTGARVTWSDGKVGLQLTRTSGDLSISRAAAREVVDDPDPWYLSSYVVCARPTGLATPVHVEGTVSQTASASRDCSRGDLYGPGGGGGLVDGGPVALQALYPNGNGVSVQLTGPLYPSVGGMIVHMTCAN